LQILAKTGFHEKIQEKNEALFCMMASINRVSHEAGLVYEAQVNADNMKLLLSEDYFELDALSTDRTHANSSVMGFNPQAASQTSKMGSNPIENAIFNDFLSHTGAPDSSLSLTLTPNFILPDDTSATAAVLGDEDNYEVYHGHFRLADINPDSAKDTSPQTTMMATPALVQNFDGKRMVPGVPSLYSLEHPSYTHSRYDAINQLSRFSLPRAAEDDPEGQDESEEPEGEASGREGDRGNGEEVDVYCVCRGPDDHSLMIQCNECSEW
jgi:hypothetical protein